MIQPAIYLLCNHSRPCKFEPPETHTSSSSIDVVSATKNNTQIAYVGHNSAVSIEKYQSDQSPEMTNGNRDFSNGIEIIGRAAQMQSIRGRYIPIQVEMWIESHH